MKPSSGKLSLDRMFVWVETWGNFAFLQAFWACSFEMSVGRGRWENDGDIIGDLATPWQSSSDNCKIYIPSHHPQPPNLQNPWNLETLWSFLKWDLQHFVVAIQACPYRLQREALFQKGRGGWVVQRAHSGKRDGQDVPRNLAIWPCTYYFSPMGS